MNSFSLKTFAVLGRTSLSNYILQALVIIPLCLVFNLFDRMTPTLALIITVSFWMAQVAWSSWWLTKYRFGPMEWILRRFTYGTMMDSKELSAEVKPVTYVTAEVKET